MADWHRVDIIVVRDPDEANQYSVYIDGVKADTNETDTVKVTISDIDFGASAITGEWVTNHLETANDLSPAAAAEYRSIIDQTAKHHNVQYTWTFFGHWENDKIIVEYSAPGEIEDDRENDGTWEEGLWAASGTGATEAEARQNAVEEYEYKEQS